LKLRSDFSAVYKFGLRRSTTHFTLRALHISKKAAKSTQPPTQSEADTPALTQIGVSISQKVSKRAVVRNRIRRRIQAAFRELLPHLSPGWRLVIVVQPVAIECDYEEILQELKQLLVSAEVMNGHSRGSVL
jgi:ribonuclease P protein component